jgi:hypothetical protein
MVDMLAGHGGTHMIELIGPVLGIGSIVGIVVLAVVLRAWDSGKYGPADEPVYESEQEAFNDIVDNQEQWG